MARVRHRHGGVLVSGWRRDDEILRLDLAEPVYGAAPGQALTLYDGDRVLGSGRLLGTDDAVARERSGGS